MGDNKQLLTTNSIRFYYRLLFSILYGGFFLSVIFYNGDFDVLHHPLSWLGGINTQEGKRNFLGAFMFAATLLTCGIICLLISKEYYRDRNIQHNIRKSRLTRLCSMGFFISITPYDVIFYLHNVGSTILFGSLWFLINLISFEFHKLNHTGLFIRYQIMLQGTLLPYAILFIINHPSRDLFQKFALIGITLALLLTQHECTVHSLKEQQQEEETEAGLLNN